MSENQAEIKHAEKFYQAHPQKKEAHHKPQKDKLDIKRLARNGLLSMLVVYGGSALTQDLLAAIPQENKSPSAPQALVSENKKETKYQLSEQEIEDKYNINLFTMKEGVQALGWTYDEQNEKMIGQAPPVRWREDQLAMVDDLMQFLPDKLYSTNLEGKRLGIMLSDFGTDCECGGVSYPGTGIIGVSNEGFNPSDREGAFSLLAHELTHRIDSPELREEVGKILGNEFYSGLDQLDRDLESDPDKSAAISTIKLISEGEFTEPVANISQFYVRGYERFMHAIGPLVDGPGYPDLEAENNKPLGIDSLPVAYPKTQALYDLYKQMIFDGKEYNFQDLEAIKYSKPQLREMVSTHREQVEDAYLIEQKIERDYKVEIENKTEHALSPTDLATISKSLNLFPKEFFVSPEGKSFKIIVTNNESDQLLEDERGVVVPNLGVDGIPDINHLSRALIHEYALKKNSDSNGEYARQIYDILGDGFKKIDHFFTDYFSTDPDENFALFSEVYSAGWNEFADWIGYVTDPGVSLEELTDMSIDHSNTKVGKIYNLMKEIYQEEFVGVDPDGVPVSMKSLRIISPLL